jgi:hypothetical protein
MMAKMAKVSKAAAGCVHGMLVDGVCECEPGWFGAKCSSEVPKKVMSHGDTVAHVESAIPTQDYDEAADDNSRCPNSCSGNGRCDYASKACICEKGWGGSDGSCAEREIDVVESFDRRPYEKHHKVVARVLTRADDTPLEATPRADGNVLFLAKAHQRLRQVVSALQHNPKDKAARDERKRLAKALGMAIPDDSDLSPHMKTKSQGWRPLNLTDFRVVPKFKNESGIKPLELPYVATSRVEMALQSDKELGEIVKHALANVLKHAMSGNNEGGIKGTYKGVSQHAPTVNLGGKFDLFGRAPTPPPKDFDGSGMSVGKDQLFPRLSRKAATVKPPSESKDILGEHDKGVDKLAADQDRTREIASSREARRIAAEANV